MKKLVEEQRAFFQTDITKSIQFRRNQLEKLYHAIQSSESEIMKALKQDLNKSEYEAYLTEIGIVYSEIKTAMRNLKKWTKPVHKKTGVANLPGKSFTMYEPYGVVLILSPWNYPFQLALAPLVGAIAAGNCCICKCSKSSPHTSALIRRILSEVYPAEYISCVDQDVSYEEILSNQYDYIFFTGSTRVGKVVMEAASKFLTPVSLELGGKSPCFVDRSANLKLTAKRLVWGKLLNAGQTCVAVDYVLVDNHVKDQLIKFMKQYEKEAYGNLCENDSYPKIISEEHFNRLNSLIEREPAKIGGEKNEETMQISFTIFPNASFQDEIMQDEIFGPILPVIGYDSLDEALYQVRRRPKPLACYMFSTREEYFSKICNQISFGGGCMNDVIMHLANHHLPFGGVGNSGMGSYHGKYSFRTFSHEKALIRSYNLLDVPLRYATFSKQNIHLLKKFL